MCPLVLAKGWTVSLLYITSRLRFLLSRHCCYFCLRSQTLQLVTPGQHVNSASRWGLFRCLSTNFRPKIYLKGNAGNICSHCLPDCQLTTYSARHTSVKFRRVSRNNIRLFNCTHKFANMSVLEPGKEALQQTQLNDLWTLSNGQYFRSCDSRNLNLSPFCTLSTSPLPGSAQKWQPSVEE